MTRKMTQAAASALQSMIRLDIPAPTMPPYIPSALISLAFPQALPQW